jgi:Family of unknown function (DUF5684)
MLPSVVGASSGGAAIILWLIYVAVIVFVIAGLWKTFTKAGEPGWAAIIPIYNYIVWLKIIGRPIWWIVLLFIPFVNFVVLIIMAIDLAKAFGKGTGFGLGLVFLSFIFIPILGFGDAQYQGAPNTGNLAGSTV